MNCRSVTDRTEKGPLLRWGSLHMAPVARFAQGLPRTSTVVPAGIHQNDAGDWWGDYLPRTPTVHRPGVVVPGPGQFDDVAASDLDKGGDERILCLSYEIVSDPTRLLLSGRAPLSGHSGAAPASGERDQARYRT